MHTVEAVLERTISIDLHGLDRGLLAELRRQTTHDNPDYGRAKSLGLSTWGVPTRVRTSSEVEGRLELPRGFASRLRGVAAEHGFAVAFRDRRQDAPVKWPTPRVELRGYQEGLVEALLSAQQGVGRAPTGSGKTIASLVLLARAAQRSLVVVNSRPLADQWVERAAQVFVDDLRVGVVGGGRKTRGRQLTVALQQSLWAMEKRGDLLDFAESFGAVLVDEVQNVGARTFETVVHAFPARYRWGVSADECVVEGTMVLLGDGTEVPIEEVLVGDEVMTPLGPRRVVGAYFKGVRATGIVEWGGGRLRGTGETWFAGPDGWVGLREVRAVRVPDELHDRPGEYVAFDCGGDRRVESQLAGEETGGRASGPSSPRLGVGGASPTVDLRSLRASERGHRDVDAAAVWDGLSVPVYDLEVEGAACYYANGVLVHNTRKDRKEFLIYDAVGPAVHEIPRSTLEASGDVAPVVVRIVPTDFEADWYVRATGAERDFGRLVDEMIADEDRHAVLEAAIREAVGHGPSLVYTARVDHAAMLADVWAFRNGITAGLLLGGEDRRARFNEDVVRLRESRVQFCAGTYQAIGTGIDVPSVAGGVCATPIGSNRQFFGQVRGRLARPGKDRGVLYYLWDRRVFRDAPRRIASWNDGLVEVRDDRGRWKAWQS